MSASQVLKAPTY